MSKKNILLVVLLLASMPLLQGCGLALIAAGGGYAAGQARKGTAKMMEAASKYTELYNEYKLGMEKINLEREKAGLKPRPIQTFEEWLKEQPLSPAEMKFFKRLEEKKEKEQKEKVKTEYNFNK